MTVYIVPIMEELERLRREGHEERLWIEAEDVWQDTTSEEETVDPTDVDFTICL